MRTTIAILACCYILAVIKWNLKAYVVEPMARVLTGDKS